MIAPEAREYSANIRLVHVDVVHFGPFMKRHAVITANTDGALGLGLIVYDADQLQIVCQKEVSTNSVRVPERLFAVSLIMERPMLIPCLQELSARLLHPSTPVRLVFFSNTGTDRRPEFSDLEGQRVNSEATYQEYKDYMQKIYNYGAPFVIAEKHKFASRG